MINQASRALTWLFLFKILSRVLDLLLNFLVIRDLDPSIYGLTTNLDLLTSFILFYLKVVLKQTYSRVKDASEQQVQSAVNLMFMGLLFTIAITPIILFIISFNQDSQFFRAAILYSIAAIIDGFSEPYAVQWITKLKLNVVAQAEGIGVLAKTIILYLLLGQFTKHQFNLNPLIAFGIASLCYSIALFGYLFFISAQTQFQKLKNNTIILSEMKSLGYQFTLMALMKFLLQELEKIVLVLYNNSTISGEFSLVSHIGSIIPRFIFSNLEQVAFNLFPKVSFEEQKSLLKTYLKLINLIGLTIVCAGIPCSKAFLSIYGEQWSTQDCILTMQIYCIYIWIMGINGITESYVNSTIDANDMWWYRYLLIAQTIIYSLSLIILIQLGSSGIIISNCLSMLVRIIISIFIMNKKNITIMKWNLFPNYFILYFVGLGLYYYFSHLWLLLVFALYYGTLGLINIYKMRTDLKLIIG